eukprot:GHVT01095628.1.p1 GENE.GHVT01095628.1~~GHVT01095628.1.p1  ORF type:complete len:577 (-),score=155.79 GHVT01095628.1:984-2714(-)
MFSSALASLAALADAEELDVAQSGYAYLFIPSSSSSSPSSPSSSSSSSSSCGWQRLWCEIRSVFFFAFEEAAGTAGGKDSSRRKLISCAILEGAEVEIKAAKAAMYQQSRQSLPALPNAIAGQIVIVRPASSSSSSPSNFELLFFFPDLATAEDWASAFEAANFSFIQRQSLSLQSEASRLRQAVELRARRAEAAEEVDEENWRETFTKEEELKVEVQRLRERVQILMQSGHATEGAAAEFSQQKAEELAHVQKHLAQEIASNEDLTVEVSEMRHRLAHWQRLLGAEQSEKERLGRTLQALRESWQMAADEPTRIAAIVSQQRDRNQLAVSTIKKLREENLKLVEHFHSTESYFQKKVAIIRSIVEAGDVFNFLKKWLICSEFKVRYYETGCFLTPGEEGSLRSRISDLQQEVRVAEAVARAFYVSHRSHLLTERLGALEERKVYSDYYALAKETLNRFGWALGERSAHHFPDGQPGEGSHESVDSPMDFAKSVPFPIGGLEGGTSCSLVSYVDVLRPVQLRVPVADYKRLKLQNEEFHQRIAQLEDENRRASEMMRKLEKANQMQTRSFTRLARN